MLLFLGCVWLFVTPWTAACQASLSFTISWSLFKLLSIESVMPSNHLFLCHPLFLLPLIFSSIRVFSSESASLIRWPKYWSFSFSINLSNEYSGLIFFFFYDWLVWSPCSPRDSQESSPTPQFKSINSSGLRLLYRLTHPKYIDPDWVYRSRLLTSSETWLYHLVGEFIYNIWKIYETYIFHRVVNIHMPC